MTGSYIATNITLTEWKETTLAGIYNAIACMWYSYLLHTNQQHICKNMSSYI